MREYKWIFTALAFALAAITASGQRQKSYANQLYTDTLKYGITERSLDPFYFERLDNPMQRITTSKAFQITYISVGLFALAGIASNNDDYIRSSRNFNIPRFSYRYDDYLQYFPGVLTYTLKAFGVESRSSWGRLATSSAFSVAIMAATVNTSKATIHKWRPDHSANNSFPSGHTSMAFMMATWLHKEYGLTESPLYSILGYSVATTIGISRVMNNKHWLSDVLTGAGVGILSSNLGYYLGDLIYGDRGINARSLTQALPPTDTPPSFISISSGYSLFSSIIEFRESSSIKVNTGFYIGAEGAYFFSKNIGVGAKLGMLTHILEADTDNLQQVHPDIAEKVDRIIPGYMAMYSVQVGPYFSFPISRRFALGSKLIAGYYTSSTSEIGFTLKADPANELVGFQSKADHGIGFEVGGSMTTLVSRNMGLRFFADYSVATSRPKYSLLTSIDTPTPTYSTFRHTRDASQNLVVGLGISAYFR